jgi:hypothetical protein
MPFKANVDRRHNISAQPHQVTRGSGAGPAAAAHRQPHAEPAVGLAPRLTNRSRGTLAVWRGAA